MNPIEQAMPSLDAMTKVEYTAKDWLMFYKNVWTRNLVARTIDVQRDRMFKEQNPDMIVEYNGEGVTVKRRLEQFKMHVEDALAIVRAIELLRCQTDEELEHNNWSPDALKVADDMLPTTDK